MEHDPHQYDDIAEQLYAPLYPVVAHAIVKRTGKTRGCVLDVGCGGGHLGFALLDEAPFDALSLLDENEQAIDLARKRAARQGLSEKIDGYYLGDVCNLTRTDVDDARFDLIVSRGSMPFWADQRAAFSNLYNLLAPGGKAYVGGGMGSARLAADITRKMEAIRAERGGTGPRPFDRSHSKALGNDAYYALFDELGGLCEIISNEEEGRWILFGKPPTRL